MFQIFSLTGKEKQVLKDNALIRVMQGYYCFCTDPFGSLQQITYNKLQSNTFTKIIPKISTD